MKNILILTIFVTAIATYSVDAAKHAEVHDYNQEYKIGSQAMVAKEYSKAFNHFIKASKLGNKDAQYSLALLYMQGLGTTQDYTQAYLWLNVAAEAKDKKWRKMRNKIKDSLSKEDKTSLAPHIDSYIEKYGSKTQEINCKRKSTTNSRKKQTVCVKKLDSNLMSLDSLGSRPTKGQPTGN